MYFVSTKHRTTKIVIQKMTTKTNIDIVIIITMNLMTKMTMKTTLIAHIVTSITNEIYQIVLTKTKFATLKIAKNEIIKK